MTRMPDRTPRGLAAVLAALAMLAGTGSQAQERPPFSVQEEVDFFISERIDWIVVKNSGGERSKSKLLAARQLGLPVAMIQRSTVPDCAVVGTAAEAHEWLEREVLAWT